MPELGYVHTRAFTLQSAAAATGNGTEADVKGLTALALQVTGTFSATVTWEGTLDGTNWIAIVVLNRNAGTQATTATAAGLYLANVAGLALFRARVSAFTSGAVTVTGRGVSVGLGALV